MKRIFTFFFTIILAPLFSQSIDWSITSESNECVFNINKVAVSKDGNFTTGFEIKKSVTTYAVDQFGDLLIDANEDRTPLVINFKPTVVITNFNKAGAISWTSHIYKNGVSEMDIVGITIDNANNSYVCLSSSDELVFNDYPLVYVPSLNVFYPTYNDADIFELAKKFKEINIKQYYPDSKELPYEADTLGKFWLLKYNAAGQIKWIKNCKEKNNELMDNITCFKMTKDGCFIINGRGDEFANKEMLSKKLPCSTTDFIAKIDTNFNVKWITPFTGYSKKCNYGTYSSESIFRLDEDDNIISVVNYPQYLFVDGKSVHTKNRKIEKPFQGRMGGAAIFIMDKEGKVVEIINSKKGFVLFDIAVKNKNIYLPISNIRVTNILGEKIDTTGGIQSALFSIDYTGKVNWYIQDASIQFYDIEMDKDENIYLNVTSKVQKKNIKEEASSIEKMFKTKKGFTTTRSNIVKLSSKGEPLTYYVLDNLIAKSQSFGENCIVREDGTLFAFGTIFNRCPFLLQEKSTLFKHGGGCYEMIYFVKLKK